MYAERGCWVWWWGGPGRAVGGALLDAALDDADVGALRVGDLCGVWTRCWTDGKGGMWR